MWGWVTPKLIARLSAYVVLVIACYRDRVSPFGIYCAILIMLMAER